MMKNRFKIIIKIIIMLPVIVICLLGAFWYIVGSTISRVGFIINVGSIYLMDLSIELADRVSCKVNRKMGA